MIKSISYDDQEIIKNILHLHCDGKDIDVDPTYSTGNFYKKGIKEPTYKFDIDPQVEGVVEANAENLPLENESVNVIMFDPPFLATTGKSLKKEEKNNIINKRFGIYPNEKELHLFYENSIKEFHRILKPNGVLIFKCQDKVSGGKQYFSHIFVHEKAREMGFYPKDLFVLLAKNRLVAKWQLKNQKNARKFHCYYWVFEKSNKNSWKNIIL